MTEFLLCAYGPFSTKIDELVKNGSNKLPYNLIIQTEGTIYAMLRDYLKICPNSENSIQMFTTTAVSLLSVKGLTSEVSQNYYLASKTVLLSIKNEGNQSVIDAELSRLETAFLNRTQPSIRPATKSK